MSVKDFFKRLFQIKNHVTHQVVKSTTPKGKVEFFESETLVEKFNQSENIEEFINKTNI